MSRLIGAGSIGAGALFWRATPPRLMVIGGPAASGIGAGGSGGASGGAFSGCGASALRQTPEGSAATGTPSCAAFIKRLQISTGRLPPETFLVGVPSSLPSQTPATRYEV